MHHSFSFAPVVLCAGPSVVLALVRLPCVPSAAGACLQEIAVLLPPCSAAQYLHVFHKTQHRRAVFGGVVLRVVGTESEAKKQPPYLYKRFGQRTQCCLQNTHGNLRVVDDVQMVMSKPTSHTHANERGWVVCLL